MDECYCLGLVGDVFGIVEGATSLEEYVETLFPGCEYVRWICGYHIHGAKAEMYQSSEDFCALDWYAQDDRMKAANEDLWSHKLIKDQVCPTNWYCARVFESMGLYEGWSGHRIGSYEE